VDGVVAGIDADNRCPRGQGDRMSRSAYGARLMACAREEAAGVHVVSDHINVRSTPLSGRARTKTRRSSASSLWHDRRIDCAAGLGISPTRDTSSTGRAGSSEHVEGVNQVNQVGVHVGPFDRESLIGRSEEDRGHSGL
jgi:hypothetical protein